MQNGKLTDAAAGKSPIAGDAQASASQAARPALDPAAAAEIDRFIDKHRRLLEKLA